MVTWQEIRHQAVIAGRLADGQTGRPIGGAQVRITAGPAEYTNTLALLTVQHGNRWPALRERLDRTYTATDGHFHFLDLPDGQYTLEASLPGRGSRYGTAQMNATVSRNPDTSVNLATVSPVVQPTTIRGHVADQLGDPVILAAVQVQGSGERAFTDTQGDYLLAGVEAGNRTVTASAQGYQPVSRQISLAQAGVEQTADFTLSAPVVSPLSISGCLLWLRASDITGVNDGDPVSAWPDTSGQGNDAVQSSNNDQPTFRANIFGTAPAVRFDGSDDHLELPLATASTDHTFFFVYDLTSGSGDNYLFDAQQGRLRLDAADDGTPSSVRWNDGDWHDVADAVPGPQILTWVFSGATGEVFRNGASLGSATYAPTPLGGRVALGSSNNGNSDFFAGDIGEVLYYSRALTPLERYQVEQNLSNRYSIPLA